eukprot:344241-Chlamydomonas_euryale.AAC.1
MGKVHGVPSWPSAPRHAPRRRCVVVRDQVARGLMCLVGMPVQPMLRWQVQLVGDITRGTGAAWKHANRQGRRQSVCAMH